MSVIFKGFSVVESRKTPLSQTKRYVRLGLDSLSLHLNYITGGWFT